MNLFFLAVALVVAYIIWRLIGWYIRLFWTFFKALRFAPVDIYLYFKERKWRIWQGFGLRIYVGMFGTGKSLSAVHYVRRNALKYGLNVLSNIHLSDVPYTPLVNYQQIIDAPGNTIVLIDELSTVFNSRAWKDFNVNLLFQLLQCRKQHKQLVCTAQRFAHVDKLIRDITADVVVCRKWWRVCRNVAYDGWDYENSAAQFAIMPLWKYAYVATNALYNAYDTDEIIDNAKRTDFVSNDDILVRRGGIQEVIPEKISKKGKKVYYGKR